MSRWAAAQAGCDAVRFSGISARMGDFSLAIETGVPEAIQYSQSGHGLPGLALPARAYMHLQTPLASWGPLQLSIFEWFE
jgi:hypothetical protein